MKKINRLIAGALSAVMLFSAAPLTAFAADADNIAVNKTASALYNRQSTVTLEVGAPDGDANRIRKNAPMAIEFVVDATDSLFYVDENRETLVDAMSDALETLADKNIYVGLTIFTSKPFEVQAPVKLTSANLAEVGDALTSIETMQAVLSAPAGTNVETGIKAGNHALENLSAVAEADKHLVLITDGGAYWWDDANGQPVNQKFMSGANAVHAGNTDVVESGYTLGSFNKNANFDRSAGTYNTSDWVNGKYTSNIEKGTYFAYRAAQEVDQLITIGLPYEYEKLERYAADFIKALPGTKIDGEDLAYREMFEAVTDALCVVPAGSSITDVIGQGKDSENQSYDFDIENGTRFTLSIGSASDTQTFNGSALSFFDGAYTLAYTAGSDEQFVLTLHEALFSSAPLKLSYTVQLAERGTKDGKHENLYTNVEAVLDTTAEKIEFPRPAVSYKIDDDKPSARPVAPVPDELNGEEHFQYVMGDTNGLVRPLSKITRAEVAAIFYRLLKDEVREQYFTTQSVFPDLNEGLWYNKAAATLANAGIFTGCDDGLFHGERNITRAELATVIAKFDDHVYFGDDLFNDISKHWGRAFINACADNGWIVGDGSGKFRPYDAITRAEVMTMINAVLNRGVDAEGLCSGYKKWPDNTEGTWYYYQVIEATNYHEYTRRSATLENWHAILPDKVWDEAAIK